MKKAKFFKISLSALLTLSMCLSVPAFASPNNAPSESVTDKTIGETEEITMDDILEKLNCGITNPEDMLTALPYDEDIEISDFDAFEYEEPERFYPEEMTDEEIEIVHQRMANGENVMFGDVVTHPAEIYGSTGTGISPRWTIKKETYPMHQWLVERAFTILGNDYPTVRNFYAPYLTKLKEAAMWPDQNENDGINNWHFYHHPTGENFRGDSSETAKSRFEDWYEDAFDAYKAGEDILVVMEYLGRAIHYLSDIDAPPHTGDQSYSVKSPGATLDVVAVQDAIQLLHHSNYEKDAYNVRNSYKISSTAVYSWYMSNSIDYIARLNANYSYLYYEYAYSGNKTDRQNAIKYAVEEAQINVAGLLYKFYHDVKSSTPPATSSNPQGSYDGAIGGPGTVRIYGWAFDYDVPSTSISIHVYVGGPAGSANAIGYNMGPTGEYRSDVNSIYGLTGNHGFDNTIYTGKRGSQSVYVYAINSWAGSNKLLGSKTVYIS